MSEKKKTPVYLTPEYNRAKCRRFYYARKLRDPEAHRAKQNRNNKAWRVRNPDKVRERSARLRNRNPEYYRTASRKSTAKAKQAVIDAYGGKCPCGITDPNLLTVDHVGGGGNAHRRLLGKGKGNGGSLWPIVRREGFPPRYRILCFNCNMRDEIERKRAKLSKNPRAQYERTRRAKLKLETFRRYGGARCALCKKHKNDVDVLSLDHIQPCGGGRKRLCGWHFYQALEKAQWPEGFRVLCLNCNRKLEIINAKPTGSG